MFNELLKKTRSKFNYTLDAIYQICQSVLNHSSIKDVINKIKYNFIGYNIGLVEIDIFKNILECFNFLLIDRKSMVDLETYRIHI